MGTTLPSFVNPMMTLSAVGGTSAVERPSGETLAQQQQRMFSGINAQLANKSLATQGQWTVTWLALTADRANLVYIATGPSNQIAVCLRGTVVSSLVDLMEDLEVGTLLPFGQGNVSQGAMKAFTEVTSATNVLGTTQTSLLQAITALVNASSSALTVYVTGHSLGGALATMVAVYLSQQSFTTQPTIQLVTFAGPTAGDASFASLVNGLSPAPVLVVNQYDAIPQAWASLSSIDSFYPYSLINSKKPGPVATLEVKALVHILNGLPGSNAFVQPTQQSPLNPDYAVFNPNAVGGPLKSTTTIFGEQVFFQHSGNTYLTLLGATPLPAVAPAITSISPSSGAAAGGTVVTITGTNFSSDSVVDFGTVPGTDVTVVSPTQITVTSPALAGTVDVQVTNMFGTSLAVPADRFTAPLS
jgi:hypothetical protein